MVYFTHFNTDLSKVIRILKKVFELRFEEEFTSKDVEDLLSEAHNLIKGYKGKARKKEEDIFKTLWELFDDIYDNMPAFSSVRVEEMSAKTIKVKLHQVKKAIKASEKIKKKIIPILKEIYDSDKEEKENVNEEIHWLKDGLKFERRHGGTSDTNYDMSGMRTRSDDRRIKKWNFRHVEKAEHAKSDLNFDLKRDNMTWEETKAKHSPQENSLHLLRDKLMKLVETLERLEQMHRRAADIDREIKIKKSNSRRASRRTSSGYDPVKAIKESNREFLDEYRNAKLSASRLYGEAREISESLQGYFEEPLQLEKGIFDHFIRTVNLYVHTIWDTDSCIRYAKGFHEKGNYESAKDWILEAWNSAYQANRARLLMLYYASLIEDIDKTLTRATDKRAA